jgi:hypothetical protein
VAGKPPILAPVFSMLLKKFDWKTFEKHVTSQPHGRKKHVTSQPHGRKKHVTSQPHGRKKVGKPRYYM